MLMDERELCVMQPWPNDTTTAMPAARFAFAVLGNAVVDAVAQVEEPLLQQFSLKKGDSNTLALPQMLALTAAVNVREFRPGGSAANTAYTLGKLGHAVVFLGLIGDDPTGRFFHDDLVSVGVTVTPPRAGHRTTEVFTLVTPDGARTMVQGAPPPPSPDDTWLDESLIGQSAYVLLGAYAAGNWPAATVLAAETAAQAGIPLAISLASPRAVLASANTLVDVIVTHRPLVMGHTTEWQLLQTICDPHTGERLEKTARVLTHSGAGARYVTAENHTIDFASEKMATPKDVSGAGDAFAAGFLHARAKGHDPATALACGHALGLALVQQLGPRLPDPAGILRAAGY
jgi:sugar/nucleoside kinase (ribokinase family)